MSAQSDILTFGVGEDEPFVKREVKKECMYLIIFCFFLNFVLLLSSTYIMDYGCRTYC